MEATAITHRTNLGRILRALGDKPVDAITAADVAQFVARATPRHLQGVPIADAAAWLGHSSAEHLATYAHATLVDRDELNYPDLLGRDRTVLSPVLSSALENAR